LTGIVVVELLKGGFKLFLSLTGDTLVITLSGNGDMDTSPALGRYLKEMHAELTRIRVRCVVVDCRGLYFMSSSCIKCFRSSRSRRRSPGWGLRASS
jgi:anti-anti-sigma factor